VRFDCLVGEGRHCPIGQSHLRQGSRWSPLRKENLIRAATELNPLRQIARRHLMHSVRLVKPSGTATAKRRALGGSVALKSYRCLGKEAAVSGVRSVKPACTQLPGEQCAFLYATFVHAKAGDGSRSQIDDSCQEPNRDRRGNGGRPHGITFCPSGDMCT